ncbi:hypothetical protein MPER_02552, partial [Moniliophthora perniciosa FA553]
SPTVVNGSVHRHLFDAMVHTDDGTMGPGDHGLAGIDAFIDGHTCNRICNSLLLSKYHADTETPKKKGKRRGRASIHTANMRNF